jgi:hypothetical protein
MNKGINRFPLKEGVSFTDIHYRLKAQFANATYSF